MKLACGHEDLEHVAVHEAGHAVFAIARSIEFRSLNLMDPREIHVRWAIGEQFMPAHLAPHRNDVSEWFVSGPEAAIDFLAAGAFAENHILGHAIPGGMSRDIDRFKSGMNVKSFTPDEALKWVRPSQERLLAEWESQKLKVERVANLVLGRFRSMEEGETAEISFQEIIEDLES